ncbi:MAG: DDE-type integrase/transposase/recombinase [Ghiorsea sp.]|nr:DDE-type integrase/transposase/recombinase [Ghiorsea sp.]
MHQQLLENGFEVSLNTVASYRQDLGLKAVLAVKQVHTTVPIQAHKKYKYKLRGLDISRANQVWSTDITYIKIGGGMVYLAAVIDWHSKAVLSHKISNTMDCALVMDVLNQALDQYGQPEIFNTDQGSQYTSDIHTQRLKKQRHYYIYGRKRSSYGQYLYRTFLGGVQSVSESISMNIVHLQS